MRNHPQLRHSETMTKLIRHLYNLDCDVYELQFEKRKTAYVVVHEDKEPLRGSETSQKRMRKNAELQRHVVGDLKSREGYNKVTLDIDAKTSLTY